MDVVVGVPVKGRALDVLAAQAVVVHVVEIVIAVLVAVAVVAALVVVVLAKMTAQAAVAVLVVEELVQITVRAAAVAPDVVAAQDARDVQVIAQINV